MCEREGALLRRGMHFRVRGGHSVLLMSVRPDAPYRDDLSEDGTVLHYEGHDAPRRGGQDPKAVDQPLHTPQGAPTQNGLFFQAALAARAGEAPPEQVRVYEKLRGGVWTDNGTFRLVDAQQEHDGVRHVFVFRLEAVGEEGKEAGRRVIPGWVMRAVWERQEGECAGCGETGDLHFEVVPPGAVPTPETVRLVCSSCGLGAG